MSKNLESIIEAFLSEAALTKGSQRVLANKSMVPGLADAVRDDARAHPQNFPAGSAKSFQKAPDEEVAEWFLTQLDKIEREGYEGTIYSKDGAYNEWIVRRYMAGSHNWEDLIGVMNMNLRDWTLLKNRGMLQTGHTDIPKFNSVRDVGKYMSTHYHDKLKDIRDAAANAAVKKQSKTAKIVDNDDYKIYTVFNWAGARTLGQGTQWCTANSKSDANYNNYSNRAMLFQLFPKNPEQVDKTGNVVGVRTAGPEKYQFDAGSMSFNDIADDVADRESIAKKFPYLYSDLISGLKQHKGELQTAIDAMTDDESLNTPATRTKHYNIDDEIKKLEKFKRAGFFTDKVRPAAKPEDDTPPQQIATEDDEMNTDMAAAQTGGSMGSMGSSAGGSGGKYSPGTAPTMPESKINKGNIMENVDKDVAAMLASLKKYDMLKESVAPVMGMVTLGGKPQLNELSQSTLKSYKQGALDDGRLGMIKGDKAKMDKRSAGMKRADSKIKEGDKPDFLDVDKDGDKEESFKKALKDKEDVKEDTKGKKEAEEIAAYKEEIEADDLAEGADADVLAWMSRFAKLGNMKGYGR